MENRKTCSIKFSFFFLPNRALSTVINLHHLNIHGGGWYKWPGVPADEPKLSHLIMRKVWTDMFRATGCAELCSARPPLHFLRESSDTLGPALAVLISDGLLERLYSQPTMLHFYVMLQWELTIDAVFSIGSCNRA